MSDEDKQTGRDCWGSAGERIAELEAELKQANTEREAWKRWCQAAEAELGVLRGRPAPVLVFSPTEVL